MFLQNRFRSASRYCRFMLQNYPLMAYVKYVRPKIYSPGKVTVVTATYNRPQVLREAIESVRSQTYEHWEHIIVSDGRDRRVESLVESFSDARIRAFHTSRLPTMGNYQRNVALLYATGELMIFLDDDNIIYPHCLQTMVQGFGSPSVGYVVCPIRYGDTVKRPGPGFRYREIDLLNYMVRRTLVETVWGQRVHANADYLLIRDIARVSDGVYMDEFIGHHR